MKDNRIVILRLLNTKHFIFSMVSDFFSFFKLFTVIFQLFTDRQAEAGWG